MPRGNAEHHGSGGETDARRPPQGRGRPRGKAVGPDPGDGLRADRRNCFADSGEHPTAQPRGRIDLGQKAVDIGGAHLLRADLRLDVRLGGAERILKRHSLLLVEQAENVEGCHLKQVSGSHTVNSSPAFFSRSLTSARLRALLMVPSGIFRSVPICFNVCPFR